MDVDTLAGMRGRLVTRLAARFGDLAEDAVAIVLARLALQIEAGDGARIRPAYVWVACANAAIDLARAAATRHEAAGPLGDYHAGPADAPDLGYSEATERALDTLTPRQREVVMLRAEGLAGQEIAARLGMSLDTVKQHFKDARKAARQGRPRSWELKLNLAERELDRMMEEAATWTPKQPAT